MLPSRFFRNTGLAPLVSQPHYTTRLCQHLQCCGSRVGLGTIHLLRMTATRKRIVLCIMLSRATLLVQNILTFRLRLTQSLLMLPSQPQSHLTPIAFKKTLSSHGYPSRLPARLLIAQRALRTRSRSGRMRRVWSLWSVLDAKTGEFLFGRMLPFFSFCKLC